MGLREFAQFHFERDLSDSEQLYQQKILETVRILIGMISMQQMFCNSDSYCGGTLAPLRE